MPDSGSPIETPAPPAPARPKSAPGPARRRRQLLILLGVVALIGGAAWGVYWFVAASRYVSTDNAYVGADTAQVTPLVAGSVARLLVSETQSVRAGQPLVILDDADARIGVAQAKAALDQAQRQVRGYYADDQALAAQVAARVADITRAEAQAASAQSDLARARTDLSRREALAASGAVSGEELTSAQNRFSAATAALAAAHAATLEAKANQAGALGARAVNAARIAGVPAASNPDVEAARARLAAAELALARTVIAAPVDGVVAKRNVQLGQEVQAGAPLMSIVPEHSAFVDANFKEVQLRKVAAGQPAVLTSDLYGGGVVFHGRVKGLAGGTGAAFSLIPAQNASGNWIKIVQRLPVRITLDPAELARHPLRVGLSMRARIDVSGRR